MTILQEPIRAGEFLISEANGSLSRERITVNAGAGKLVAGTVMAQRSASNSGTPTAAGGNTGNGTMGSVTVGNDAITGTYTLTITAEDANGGSFEVTNPHGEVVGEGEVGVAFSGGGISFTLADGSEDFDEGDSFTIAVIAGLGEWVAYDDDGTDDGRRVAKGVLYSTVDATLADADGVLIARHAEVQGDLLTGLDSAGIADLAALDIIVR